VIYLVGTLVEAQEYANKHKLGSVENKRGKARWTFHYSHLGARVSDAKTAQLVFLPSSIEWPEDRLQRLIRRFNCLTNSEGTVTHVTSNLTITYHSDRKAMIE
jgi:hypothetical protein